MAIKQPNKGVAKLIKDRTQGKRVSRTQPGAVLDKHGVKPNIPKIK